MGGGHYAQLVSQHMCCPATIIVPPTDGICPPPPILRLVVVVYTHSVLGITQSMSTVPPPPAIA